MLKNPASFRDPSGFVFEHEGEIYRNISSSYAKHFEFLTSSGLRDKLFEEELLIRHQPVDLHFSRSPAYQVIKPEKIQLITYPYEWSFTQLKEAALLTLRVLKTSLDHAMILKDGSSYNVQFRGYKAVFIDTLSFEIYQEGKPWSGYRQFCEHFLGPLCLASRRGVQFLSLLKLDVEGIPLKMASQLLPATTWMDPATLFHVHLHAKTIERYAVKSASAHSRRTNIPKKNLLAMIDHLTGTIGALKLKRSDRTQWQNYHLETHYSAKGKNDKAAIIRTFLKETSASVVWDVGANDGFFSQAISDQVSIVLSLDFDPLAIDKNYNDTKEKKLQNIYPLLFNVVNPSANIGWANEERRMLSLRSNPDLIMALALIHHLVITHNIPFSKIADYFASIAPWLILEFVPEDDEKIKTLPDTAGKRLYNRKNFLTEFLAVFEIVQEIKIADSGRALMLLKNKLS